MNPFLPIYESNRERFLSSLDGAAALIFSSPMVTRSNDTEYAYRPDSDMLYLSGLQSKKVLTDQMLQKKLS